MACDAALPARCAPAVEEAGAAVEEATPCAARYVARCAARCAARYGARRAAVHYAAPRDASRHVVARPVVAHCEARLAEARPSVAQLAEAPRGAAAPSAGPLPCCRPGDRDGRDAPGGRARRDDRDDPGARGEIG